MKKLDTKNPLIETRAISLEQLMRSKLRINIAKEICNIKRNILQ